MQNECSLLWIPVSPLFLFCATLPRALNMLKEAKWEEVKEHGEGVGRGIAPSSPCDVVYLPKKGIPPTFRMRIRLLQAFIQLPVLY